MIVQAILDFLVDGVRALIGLIPAMPAELAGVVGDMQSASVELGQMLTKLGIIVPFDTFSVLLSAWAGLMGFWAALMLVRLLLWLLGR